MSDVFHIFQQFFFYLSRTSLWERFTLMTIESRLNELSIYPICIDSADSMPVNLDWTCLFSSFLLYAFSSFTLRPNLDIKQNWHIVLNAGLFNKGSWKIMDSRTETCNVLPASQCRRISNSVMQKIIENASIQPKSDWFHVLIWKNDPQDFTQQNQISFLKAEWKRSSKKQKPTAERWIGSSPCSNCPHVKVSLGKTLIHELLPLSLAAAAHWYVCVCMNERFCKARWVAWRWWKSAV